MKIEKKKKKKTVKLYFENKYKLLLVSDYFIIKLF